MGCNASKAYHPQKADDQNEATAKPLDMTATLSNHSDAHSERSSASTSGDDELGSDDSHDILCAKKKTNGSGNSATAKLVKQLTGLSKASSRSGSEHTEKSECSQKKAAGSKFGFRKQLTGDWGSSFGGSKKKFLKKQLTVTDMGTAHEASGSKSEPKDDEDDEKGASQTEEEAKCNSPRGSFFVESLKTTKQTSAGGRTSEESFTTRAALRRSFSMTSHLDAEGGDKKSFEEKSFKQKGVQSNAEDHGIYVTCRKGAKSKKSPNQDSWYVLKSESHSVYGVFDGHGRKGHDISNFVKRNLPKLIENDSRFRTDQMPALIVEAFEEMTHLLETATSDMQIDANKSGTTATIVIHDEEKDLLTLAWVGDSGAAIARGLNSEMTDAEYLTPNHTAAEEEELRRIEDYGGRVEFDGHSYRVYLMDAAGPGLNMSRAFGDLQGRPAGIVSIPDVIQVKLNKSDQFIVLCSDGIWEFISADEAAAVAEDAMINHRNPAKEMALEALRRWNTYADVVDDITCIVVDFQRDQRVNRPMSSELSVRRAGKGDPPKKVKRTNSGDSWKSSASREDYDEYRAASEGQTPTIPPTYPLCPTRPRNSFSKSMLDL